MEKKSISLYGYVYECENLKRKDMELDKVIEKRRSIRSFDAGLPVDIELVKQAVAAAQMAPTWKNSQTGRYYVISGKEILEKFKEECLHPYNAKNSAGAPVLIVTSYVGNVSGFKRDGSQDNELGNEWGAYDLGLQNANLLLKAAELGLSTLVMGLRDADRIREMLAVPENEIIVSVIAVGYAATEAERPVRKPIGEIVKFY